VDVNKIVPFQKPKRAGRRTENFRRAMAAEQTLITAIARDMFRVEPDDGPAHWTAILRVPTRNISTCSEAEQERVAHHLMKFVNGRTERFQWKFTSRPIDPTQILSEIEERLRTLPEHDDRRMWLLDMREHLQCLVRTNSIPQAGLYLVLQVAAKKDFTEVQKQLNALCTRAISDLHAVGVEATRLNTMEILCLLWADFNPDLILVHKKPAEYNCLVSMARPKPFNIATLGDYMALDDPLSARGQMFLDVIAPQDVEYHRDRMELNTVHRAVLVARGWPSFLQFDALRHLTNSHLQIEASIHVSPVDTSEALRYLDDRIKTLTMAAAKDEFEGFTPDHRVLKFKDQAVYCREQLETGHQRWFFAALYVAVTSNTEEQLREDVRTVQALLNQADIKVVPAFRQQREGQLACMPLAYDPIDASRNMLSDALAFVTPLDAQSLMHPAGMYAGLSRVNNSLVILNVWALKNYNIVIMGVPGSGKTVALRNKLMHVHTMTDDAQIIGDPDGEMDVMIEQMGGTVVRLGGNSPHRINIMDLALDWDDERGGYRRGRPLDKQIPLLTSWLEYQIGAPGDGGRRFFDPVQRAHVMHAVVRAYGRCGITPENQGDLVEDGRLRVERMPTLEDLQEEIRETEPQLAEAMGIFTFGAMSLFNARTNVDLAGARLISLNLRDLDPATRYMAMPWLVNWMWGRVGLNRYHKRNTHLYFEEILWFLQEPIAAEYISMIWTRGRKWRCCPTAVSQLLERLMATEVGRTIVKTSDLKILLDQGEALPEMQAHCQLYDSEASFIRGSTPGNGLYVVGPYRIPFSLALSEFQYKYFTTKPGEMQE
jgi:hypothetical protein